jgi:esterase/lipase superfamily enzyme
VAFTRELSGPGLILGWVLAPILGGVGWTIVFLHRKATGGDLYTVWYGTNRKLSSFGFFGVTQDSRLNFGTCMVTIPETHKFGSIGSSAIKRFLMRLFHHVDDQLHLYSTTALDSVSFVSSIQRALLHHNPKERCIFIYIHGFNVTFEQAAIRAAQIGFDLKIPGVMGFFSWPSRFGGVRAYPFDEDAIAASEEDLAKFLIFMAHIDTDTRINLLAHSMGNRGLLRALNNAKHKAVIAGVKFGQIFLAAPDIDTALFKQLADVYREQSERTTLYISSVDRALELSVKVHQNQRLGYCPPVITMPGIDTVEVTQIDIGFLGHSYYAEAAGVLHDMWSLIRTNIPADQRPTLVPTTTEDGQLYWRIRG